MAQNDPHVALIILTIHMWGKIFEKKIFRAKICVPAPLVATYVLTQNKGPPSFAGRPCHPPPLQSNFRLAHAEAPGKSEKRRSDRDPVLRQDGASAKGGGGTHAAGCWTRCAVSHSKGRNVLLGTPSVSPQLPPRVPSGKGDGDCSSTLLGAFWMVIVISWCALDGHCYFPVRSGWSVIFPGALWMVILISWCILDGQCYFVVCSRWSLLFCRALWMVTVISGALCMVIIISGGALDGHCYFRERYGCEEGALQHLLSSGGADGTSNGMRNLTCRRS